MRDTPPPPPIPERVTEALVEDLCIALRNVGVWDSSLPEGERVIGFIEEVRALHAELAHRRHVVTGRIERLSSETTWQTTVLLEECLRYPAVIPWVRERDGIRRRLRCTCCRTGEFPFGDPLWVCDSCVANAIKAIRERTDMSDVVVFRTYSPAFRCEHADDETVLVSFAPEYDSSIRGMCEACLGEVQTRRRGETRHVS